jgi:hypothetical protein
MEEKEKDHFVVPGRLTIEELHKQHEELLAAKKVSDLHPKPTVLNAMSMISVGLDFALILALPLLGFIYLGRWMDARYETKFFVVLALPLAIIVSSIGIYKQIKKLKKIRMMSPPLFGAELYWLTRRLSVNYAETSMSKRFFNSR